jgi:hypothetical protein
MEGFMRFIYVFEVYSVMKENTAARLIPPPVDYTNNAKGFVLRFIEISLGLHEGYVSISEINFFTTT